MVSASFSKAASEVLAILDNTDESDVSKIPKKFMDFLKENSLKSYTPSFDRSKKINELNLNPKTQALLGLIYMKFWAYEEQKKEFQSKVKENEKKYQQELSQKYNIDSLFNSKLSINQQNNTKQDALVIQKEESFIKKILKNIKGILGGK